MNRRKRFWIVMFSLEFARTIPVSPLIMNKKIDPIANN